MARNKVRETLIDMMFETRDILIDFDCYNLTDDERKELHEEIDKLQKKCETLERWPETPEEFLEVYQGMSDLTYV